MKHHPYRYEIVGTFLFGPLVLALETWRRWGELLSPVALDDWVIFLSAMFVAGMLFRRDTAAPTLWVFVCGGAWFLFLLSTWASIYSFDEADPSGVPVPGVIAFKLFGLTLISLASLRALRRLLSGDPYRAIAEDQRRG